MKRMMPFPPEKRDAVLETKISTRTISKENFLNINSELSCRGVTVNPVWSMSARLARHHNMLSQNPMYRFFPRMRLMAHLFFLVLTMLYPMVVLSRKLLAITCIPRFSRIMPVPKTLTSLPAGSIYYLISPSRHATVHQREVIVAFTVRPLES
jgi:hypothetical protein